MVLSLNRPCSVAVSLSLAMFHCTGGSRKRGRLDLRKLSFFSSSIYYCHILHFGGGPARNMDLYIKYSDFYIMATNSN